MLGLSGKNVCSTWWLLAKIFFKKLSTASLNSSVTDGREVLSLASPQKKSSEVHASIRCVQGNLYGSTTMCYINSLKVSADNKFQTVFNVEACTGLRIFANATGKACTLYPQPRPNPAMFWISKYVRKLVICRICRKFSHNPVPNSRSLIQPVCTSYRLKTSYAGGRHNMPPPPVTLTFHLLTLKMVS